LEEFETNSTSYQQVFPYGQPFKSLYALYALREHIESARRTVESNDSLEDAEDLDNTSYARALKRAETLLVAAISDKDVVDRSNSERLQLLLTLYLMSAYSQLLRGKYSFACLCLPFYPSCPPCVVCFLFSEY
jgi:ubiquitin carboxyl-terminal hydrolase 34